MVGASEPIEQFAAAFNEIVRSADGATEKSERLAKELEKLRGVVPDAVVLKLREMTQGLSEGAESVEDLNRKLERIRGILADSGYREPWRHTSRSRLMPTSANSSRDLRKRLMLSG